MEKEENFHEFVYGSFYEFSHTKPEQIGLVFSRDIVYPILELNPHLQMLVPLPKLIDGKYAFEGMLFENTQQGRISLWSLFLATVYHLSAHAAISTYVKYEEWRKNKTEDVSWQVIDFIEDIKVHKYISHTNGELWRNIEDIEFKLVECLKGKKTEEKISKKNSYFLEEDMKNLKLVRDEIFASKENKDNEKITDLADFLYANRILLSNTLLLPCQERHKPQWFIKFGKEGPVLEPSGVFEEQVMTLDELWQLDEQAKAKLLRRYEKHFKNLNFDKIVIPSGNIQNFTQIKLDNISFLRKVRERIMVLNLMDDSKICDIGNLDLQMAIQSIASEGITNEIFEHDELRRGEEAWIILVDKSDSMRVRFKQIKEFVVCISESSNELTGTPNAWALYSFDNNFQILKDFRENYNLEVQARIGALRTGGPSLIPDAIELATRILREDPRERKYILVITDGYPSGYERDSKVLSNVIKKTEISGITLLALGISKAVSRSFKNNSRGSNLKQLVDKFITAYRTVSSSDM